MLVVMDTLPATRPEEAPAATARVTLEEADNVVTVAYDDPPITPQSRAQPAHSR